MTTILILGGYGYTGKFISRYLLRESKANIILAGRNLDRGKEFAKELDEYGDRVRVAFVDAAQIETLRTALTGVDLLLVAAPTTQYTEDVARAALSAGIDYLDIQYSSHKLEILHTLEEEIQEAGLCFITEAGYHPGLPSAMVRYAASQLGTLERAYTAGYLNMGNSLPYSEAVDELMEAFKNYQAQTFKDSKWTKPSKYDIRKFDFGGDIGCRTCYSMYFEELHGLPEMYPSLMDTGFYISGSHWIVDMLITPIVMIGLKLIPRRGIRPLGKFMWWGMQTFTKAPYQVVLRVEADGQLNGHPTRVYASIAHPDGYELTAIPVVAFLSQYLDGSARRPGLWMMGHLVEPMRMMEDMSRMGVAFETTITQIEQSTA